MTGSGPLAGLPLLEDLGQVGGRRVLVRVDYNVPLEERDGARTVADDFRIRATLPTLRWLLERDASVTVCSHLGRPRGTRDERWSMAPVARRLAELCPGVELAENLRFDPGEEANDPGFVERLTDGFDAYVNEAFGASHREHASVMGPPARLPSAAGRLLAREVEVLGGLLEHPARPFVVVLGGAKVADKIGVVRSLVEKADTVAIGGAMAFTFLAALGHEVGASPVYPDYLNACAELLGARGSSILLPTDLVALAPGGAPLGFEGEGEGDETEVLPVELPEGWQGLDIGPKTAGQIEAVIAGAATVFWNGPVGAFEDPRFAEGTARVARAVAEAPAYSVVGGGDSARAIDGLGLAERIDFVSTGGGASLALLEHGDLPALAALRRAANAPGSRTN